MVALGSHLSVLLLGLTVVQTTPAFNKVNLYDSNGNFCPVTPAFNVTCPQLCVSSLDLCPSSIRPACGISQEYCVDGSCRDSCPENLVNPCACASSKKKSVSLNLLSMKPCLFQPNVDIYQYDPRNPKTAESVCARELNITGVTTWTANSQKEMVWLQCPAYSPPINLKTPMFISIWTVLGLQGVIVALWSLFKSAKESKLKDYYSGGKLLGAGQTNISTMNGTNLSGRQVAETQSNSVNIQTVEKHGITLGSEKQISAQPLVLEPNGENESTMVEYTSHFFGRLAFYSIFVSTISWLVFVSLVVLDYYGLLTGTEASLTGASFALLHKFFIVLWCFITLWLLSLSTLRHRIDNFFRLKTKLGNGDVVEVSQYEEIVYFQEKSAGVLVESAQKIEKVFKKSLGLDRIYSTCKVCSGSENSKYIEFRSTRYVFQPQKQDYECVQISIGTTGEEIYRHMEGLSEEEARYRSQILGDNFIRVDIPSVLKSIGNEFSSFFYIYQLMIILLFYYYSYYQVALSDSIVVLLSASIKVYINMKSERRLKTLTEYVDSCLVFRDGVFREEKSSKLVIGDIVAVENNKTITFDGVLIKGELIVDESSLTGEAMPVRKIMLSREMTSFNKHTTGKVNSVFAGTRVLQSVGEVSAQPGSKTDSDTFALAVVSEIGTFTDKGKMIRKILHPTKFMFTFNKQIRLVMVILFLQGMLWLSLAAWLLKASSVAAFFSGLGSLSQLISPLLPASLVIGQSVAVQRLKQKNIYCIEMPRVMVAGKIEIFCFDKTGTLTKDGLEFGGAVECIRDNGISAIDKEFTKTNRCNIATENKGNPDLVLTRINEKVQNLGENTFIGIGSCHSVTRLNDQLIGNPVDVEMFQNSGWTFGQTEGGYLQTLISNLSGPGGSASDSAQYKVHIVKRNEFSHSRASMSVVIRNEASDSFEAFAKGSSERIYGICDKTTIPNNYSHVADVLSSRGCYVIALAKKTYSRDITLDSLRNSTVDEIESGMAFVGFLLFNNNLKPETTLALEQIKASNTRNVMITGDATLTGIFIARECGMIPEGSTVVIGDLDHSGSVEFRNVDTSEIVTSFSEFMAPSDLGKQRNLELAVTGAAFERMASDGSIRSYIKHIRVFGRMTPTNKVQCINYQMELGVTAMCGDGGNDSGALKAAHVGIALSSAEASIVSPFSSTNKSLMSCVDLLLQSRAALATSFANYKHLVLYGQTMALFKVMTMYFSINISQPLWVFIDAFITVFMSLAISLSKPADKLSEKRPTAKLFGLQTLASSIGQVLINWVFMIVAFSWLFKQSWYRCHEFDSSQSNLTQWWLLGDNYEAEVAGLISLYQFVNVALIYNFGYLYRQRWYKNYVLLSLWALFFGLISYIGLADPNRLGCLLRINCGDPDVLVTLGYKRPSFSIESYNIPSGYNVLTRGNRLTIWGMSVGNMAVGVLWELLVVLGPVGNYVSTKFPKDKPKINL